MPEPMDSEIFETHLSFPLYVCAKEIARQYSVYLEEFDLTYTQYIAMRIIWEKKSVSVHDMGRVMFLDSGTLTPLLKKLEAKGYVARTRSTEDARKLMISATDKGADLQEKVAFIPAAVGKGVEVSDEDMATLREMTTRLTLQVMEAGKSCRCSHKCES